MRANAKCVIKKSMNRDLYRSIRSLRDHERGIRPDASWVCATRERLLMQVGNTMPSAETAAKNRETVAAAHPGLLKLARGPALVVLSIIFVLLGGSFASVRASDDSLPGDALYMIKLVSEQTQLALASSKPEKVRLKVAFTKRRVEDLKTVVEMDEPDQSKKEERVSKAADILKQDLHTLKQQLADVSGGAQTDEDARQVAETVKQLDRETVGVLKTLEQTKKEGFGPEVKQKVADAQAQASDVGIKALEMLVEARKSEQTGDVVSEEEIGASLAEHAQAAKDSVAEILLTSSAASTSSQAEAGSSTSTDAGLILAKDAENALAEMDALLLENRTAEAIAKLKEASTKSFLAQSEASKILTQEASNAAESSASGTAP
jgi:hypothetical protein